MPRYGPGQSGPPPKPPRARARPPAVPATTAPRTTRADVRATTTVKPAPRKTPAQGGAVLARGTFQPGNRKQQAELAQNARQEGQRLERVRQAKAAHQRALKLYKAGNHKGAMALNAHARQMAGLPAFESPGVVGKVIEQTAKDLGQAAYYTPGGLYATGKAGVAAARGNPKPLEEIGKQVAKGTEESFTHPLRHPGYTALNALAVASLGAGAVSRVGAAGEALRSGEGVGAAIARPGFKGGSLLHKKPPGEINLPGGAQALEPDNPLLRPVKRARMKRVKRAAEQGRELAGPSAVRRHLGAQNVIGRELRAREQVQADIAQAPIEAMKQRVKKLTPEENTALRVVATEGSHALRHPEETIGRHVQTHLAHAAEGTAPKLNREIAKDLQVALPVLKARRPEFMRAVASARRVSKQSEAELVGGERLSQEAADARRGKIAELYGHPAESAGKRGYRGRHQIAPGEPGSTMDDLSAMYPPDLYSAKGAHYYGSGGFKADRARDERTVALLRSVKGKPDAEVTVYRAVPKEAGRTINPGDWVTPSKAYARLHGQSNVHEGYVIAARKVRAGDLYSEGNSVHEWGWNPSTAAGTPPKGSFYFPTGERFKFPTKPLKGGAVSRRPGPGGLGPVDASRYLQGTTKRFTGKGLKTGVVGRPGEAIASRATGTAKLASAERVHGQLLKLATPERRGEYDIPIRATRKISQADRRKVAAALEEAQTGDKTALVRSENAIKDAIAPRQGEKAVYVDRRYLKEITGGTASKIAKGGAAFNKPFRVGGVYLRPAYVATNRPQNFLMRHLQQGLRTKKPIRGTVGHMRRQLGEELTAKIDATSGQTRTEAFTPQGFTKRGEQKITGAISEATDRSERFLAVLARAHEKGYRSEADLRRLYADNAPAKVVNDRVAIGRRASKDMVDFRSVTPVEHEVSDLIYFYPWLSRATGWSARFVANHPVKSAALASVAPIGEKEQRKALGPVPAWLKGFIPTSKGLVHPASVNTFETPAQIGQYLANPTGPQANSFGEEFGTPVVQALTTPPSQWGKKALQSQALGLMAERFGLVGKTPKTFPKTGVGPALGPFTFGGFYPRAEDKAVIAKQALTALPSPERARAKMQAKRVEYLTAAKKAGLAPKDAQHNPDSVKQAFDLRTMREVAYARAGKQLDQKQRFTVDQKLLLGMKKITAAQAATGEAWAKKATDKEVAAFRRELGNKFFGTLTLENATRQLNEHGASVSLR